MDPLRSYVVQQERQILGSITHLSSNPLVNVATISSCSHCGHLDIQKVFDIAITGFPSNTKHEKIANNHSGKFALIVDERDTL